VVGGVGGGGGGGGEGKKEGGGVLPCSYDTWPPRSDMSQTHAGRRPNPPVTHPARGLLRPGEGVGCTSRPSADSSRRTSCR